MRTLREGPGAGYDVIIKGLKVKPSSITIGDITDGNVSFTAELETSQVEFYAEGYDWGVDSERDEYGFVEGNTVIGGTLKGSVEAEQDVYDIDTGWKTVTLDHDELIENIASNLSDFDVKSMVGGGYFHCSLGESFTFDETEYSDLLYSEGEYAYDYVKLESITINAPDVGASIENAYNGRYDELEESKKLNEAVDGGWEVKSSEAWEAYEFACEHLGKEYMDGEIIRSLGTDELAACLAFIFRMNDFREWDARNGIEEDDDSDDEMFEDIYDESN